MYLRGDTLQISAARSNFSIDCEDGPSGKSPRLGTVTVEDDLALAARVSSSAAPFRPREHPSR